ncbi:MAG TPA: DUF4139 domain-containing protein [Polyangia bacterium]|jgi:hypothetical protein
MEITCEAPITSVTVHARGALVTRRAVLPPDLPAGDVVLVIPGVTALCDRGSLRAALTGERDVVAVQAALEVPAATEVAGPSVQRVRALTLELERLQEEHALLAARREVLAADAVDPRLRPASTLERIDERLGDAVAAAGALDRAVADLDGRLEALEEQIEEVSRRRDAAVLADLQAPTHARVGGGHPTVRLTVHLAGAGAAAALDLTYSVSAARFWPAATVRLAEGGAHATWTLEALVAQLSGEDWPAVALALSTADLIHDARLPELPSLRLGKAQPPARRGYRPAPAGLDQLFAGHDAAFPALPRPAPAPRPQPQSQWQSAATAGAVPEARALPDTGRMFGFAASESAGDVEEELAAAPYDQALLDAPPPSPAAMPAPASAPPFAPAPSFAPQGMPLAAKRRSFAPARASVGAGGGREEAPPVTFAQAAPEALAPAEDWLDFDALTLAPAGDRARRGRLRRADDRLPERAAALARIDALAPNLPHTRDPLAARGHFDSRYDADGVRDLPSDGLVHRLTLQSAETVPVLRFRTVPREAPEVYREAELVNPFAVALLAGPADVYVEGSLLLTAAAGAVDRGGRLTLGMGVEDRLRVARNVRVEEESAGLLGGKSAVTHTVHIELRSNLGRPATVEVLDRVPVSDEKDVEVKLVAMQPDGERYDQADRGAPVRGGWRWTVEVPAGGTRTIEYQYRVTLPAKSTIVGGNRRD